ncbi:MAG: hypothetical protein LBB75_00785 [Oscillospiraceae bacterium]|jgi:hypothetical protein|nr:hypothetical protein [Oscillospiraceae bacterium]
MKTTKRILCIALALLLGSALLAPAALAAEDPNAPVITKQPKSFVALFAGKTLTVEVAAALPTGTEGSGGTLSYAWYDYDWQPGDFTAPIATGAKVTVDIPVSTDETFGREMLDPNRLLCAVVTNTYVDAEGATKTASTKSGLVKVLGINPIGTALSLMWSNLQEGKEPWFGIDTYGIGQLLWSSVITFPTMLFLYLPAYFVGWTPTLIYTA